ncbi:MAG: MlaD family protein [Desulfobulbaceae bacterium]|nr:MlaD family protein [Desulfobulbaceae bacterium]HIJ79832.1 MCE family protein [Deltaproteobacteria bacterium]
MKKPPADNSPHYIHGMAYSFQERLVGTFVLLAMVALFGLLIATGKTKYLFEDHVTIYGYLPTAHGLATDSTIRISGIDGGYVSDIAVSEKNEIIVSMRIFKRFHRLLRADSVASIRNISLLGAGSGTIEISAGSPDQPLLQDQADIKIQEAFSVEDLATEITTGIRQVQSTISDLAGFVKSMQSERLSESMADVEQITGNLRKITDQLAAGGGVLGAALYDEEMKKDIKNSVSSLSKTVVVVEKRLKQLEPVLTNTGELSSTLKDTLKDFPKVMVELKNTMTQVNNMLNTMDNEVQQLPELVGKMRILLEESDRTLRAAQRVWPLSQAVEQTGDKQLLIAPQAADE